MAVEPGVGRSVVRARVALRGVGERNAGKDDFPVSGRCAPKRRLPGALGLGIVVVVDASACAGRRTGMAPKGDAYGVDSGTFKPDLVVGSIVAGDDGASLGSCGRTNVNGRPGLPRMDAEASMDVA